MMLAGHKDDGLLGGFDHLPQQMEEKTCLAVLPNGQEGELQTDKTME